MTDLLRRWRSGDGTALERLLPLVYGALRRLAGSFMRGEHAGHALETHDLIHEAFLRLVDQRAVDWQGRAHLFDLAARMMRRVLVDQARRRRSTKGGGARTFMTRARTLRVLAARLWANISLDTSETESCNDKAAYEAACKSNIGMP